MLIGQCGHGFDFQNHPPVADEIRLESLAQGALLVGQWQMLLGLVRYHLHSQFNLQALLIYRFGEAVPLLIVNLKTRPNDPIAFLFTDDFCHGSPFSSFVLFVLFVGYC